jgi:hypothetical protein
MARPTTKEQLIQAGEDNFNKMFALINSMTKEQQELLFLFEDRDKNIRDVLVHLFEWHMLLLNWINSNQSGKRVNFLPEPYNWKTYPEMNIKFWEKHKATPYEESIRLIKQSHLEVIQIINTFSNEELFTKKYFDWTGSTSLGSYCVSATSSHYDWAIKKIEKHKKSLKK